MSRPIIYFDGLCGLCDGFVRFITARDRLGLYRFAPLQGETARVRLEGLNLGGLKTVVLEVDPAIRQVGDREGIRTKSDAAIAILAGLGGGWRLMNGLRIIPGFLRNMVYDLISMFRYRWFGKRKECRIPLPEERIHFLP